VAEKGIDLGNMDAKLLQKIEELTLYMIEQHKQNQSLVKIVKTQQSLLEEMKKEIAELKKH
jgi:transcriptional accessory protein Tex/SPT6